MPCMGQTRCFSRPITFWSPFIKKKTIIRKKQYYKKNRGKFHSRQFGDRIFFTVAKPKFTVAISDHQVANVEPCKHIWHSHQNILISRLSVNQFRVIFMLWFYQYTNQIVYYNAIVCRHSVLTRACQRNTVRAARYSSTIPRCLSPT